MTKVTIILCLSNDAKICVCNKIEYVQKSTKKLTKPPKPQVIILQYMHTQGTDWFFCLCDKDGLCQYEGHRDYKNASHPVCHSYSRNVYVFDSLFSLIFKNWGKVNKYLCYQCYQLVWKNKPLIPIHLRPQRKWRKGVGHKPHRPHNRYLKH